MMLNFEAKKDASSRAVEASAQKLRDMGAEVTVNGRSIDADFKTDESWKRFQQAMRSK